jgi:hypothetical protein
MSKHRRMTLSVAAAAALLASTLAPVATSVVFAQAQAPDGKGQPGIKRGDGPGKSGPSPRTAQPIAKRAPATRTVVRPAETRRETTSRIVIRDRDRRGSNGEGNRRRGTRYVWGSLPFYYYDGFYHGDCSWLRRKVRETGSSYWRTRLQKCRDE